MSERIEVIKKEEIEKKRIYERQVKIAHLDLLVEEFPEQAKKFVEKHVLKRRAKPSDEAQNVV
jgi:hypothetical protein